MSIYQKEDLQIYSSAVNYRNYIFSLFHDYCVNKRVIEVGAGIGSFTEYLLSLPGTKVTALEPDKECFSQLVNSKSTSQSFTPINSTTMQMLYSGLGKYDFFDVAVYLNVLEHIEDETDELKNIYKMLKTGAYLLICVPAYNFLYSQIDKNLGHRRRYNKKYLSKVLADNNFSIYLMRYHNVIGVAGWFFNRIVKRHIQSQNQFLFFDRYLFPISQKIDALLGYRCGLSLFCVARKL